MVVNIIDQFYVKKSVVSLFKLQKFKKERIISNHSVDEETDELKKIKKVIQ